MFTEIFVGIFKFIRMRPIPRSDESDASPDRVQTSNYLLTKHTILGARVVSKSALATVSQRIFAFHCLK